MSYQKWIGRLLFSVIAGWLLLPVQASAGSGCTFNDTGIVNFPAQITVPTNTPLGAVIATGEADIDFTCQGETEYFFAKLARCGDYHSEEFACAGVSVENIGNNAAMATFNSATRDSNGSLPWDSKYRIFYSPYMGVGMRMKVKYIDSSSFAGGFPNARQPELMVSPLATRQFNENVIRDRPWGQAAEDGAYGILRSKGGGGGSWKGKLIVELVKIENRWSSQQKFDDYSSASYQEFVEGQAMPYPRQIYIQGKNGNGLGLLYRDHNTRLNLNREEFLSHAMYMSFGIYPPGQVFNRPNISASRVYRLNTRIVEPITCTVTTPVVNVDMGNVSANDLDKGAAPERTFNVGINCPGGARIAMAFSDNSEPSNTSNTLTISKNSEAAGIGLQLRKDSTPITYNSSNSNMILVAELANAGFVNVPLVAKVVKTGPVRVGRFTAQSTITLGYQ